MRILILDTIYDSFLKTLYATRPALVDASYDDQIDAIAETFFPCGLTWRGPLRRRGHDVVYVAANNPPAQIRWCDEHGRRDLIAQSAERHMLGFHEHRVAHRRPWYLTIAREQVKHYRPDVILCPFLYEFENEFLESVAGAYGCIVGQHAASIPGAALTRYDLIISSLPNQVAHFRSLGIRAELLPLAFDPEIATRLGTQPLEHDVAFLGQVSVDHTQRADHLRTLAASVDIAFWGDADWGDRPPDASRWRARPALWGLDMYRTMARSRIALNHHLDAAGPYANNLRLYEATGVGTLLLTDHKDNLAELFVIGEELVTYRDSQECVAQIRALLGDEPRRRAIAAAGQQRVLRDHTYDHRAQTLLEMIDGIRPRRRTASLRERLRRSLSFLGGRAASSS